MICKTCNPYTADDAKRQLVIANRILAHEGLLDCFGHISVRNPENIDTFFQSRSLAAEFVTMDDIFEIDFDGNVIDGPDDGKPYWERFLHARIFAARPDVNSVYHGHPDEMIMFANMPEVPLLPVVNCGGVFYNGYSYYSSGDGSDMTVKTIEEADEVTKALGDKWAVLMRCHGVTVAAGNIPELVIDTISMVKNARIYAEVIKMGQKTLFCSPEEGLAYRTSHHMEHPLYRNWNYHVRHIQKIMTDVADL